MSDLRARQKALARRTIAQAAGALSGERPLLDFSMQDVADRAGVSLRTVYNHFASREEVFEGLLEHLDEQFREQGGMLISDVTALEQLRDGVRVNFPIFERLGPMVAAVDGLAGPRTAVTEDHDRRTRRIVELVIEALPDLPAATATRVGRILRHVVSRRTWAALTVDYGMTTDEAAASSIWTFDTVLAAARRGEVGGLGQP